MAPPPYSAHLLVVLHGLWGSPSHIRYVCESAIEHTKRANSPRAKGDDGSRDVKLVVLAAKLNEFTATYDGIDLCAERALNEVDDEVERIRKDGGRVERFSIVGYSLGGLVARYLLGLLDSRSPSFFDSVRPVNFATFASPWVGIPKYETFWSGVFRFLGARLLSRSGSQLYEKDRFLPSHFDPSAKSSRPPSPSKGFFKRMRARDKAEPLLKILADPRFSFYRALAKFERVEVFANTVNDRTVPFPTGALELHDPFALARAKARKAAEARGDDPEEALDLSEGGLEIILHEDAPIIASYRQLDSPTTSKKPTLRRRFNFRLPLLLRPTAYPFSRPVSLLVIALLPVALPLSVMYLVGRFLVQGRSSKRRIRELRKLTAGDRGREGMLERVGVKVREIAEQVGTDNPEYAADLAGDERVATGRLAANGGGLTSGEVTEYDPPTAETTPATSGAATPDFARGGLPPTTLGATSSYDSEDSASSTDPLAEFAQPTHAEARQFSTDPVFSSSQLFQAHHLNALPQMRKHFVYLPRSRNSHGAIVRRDPRFEQHRIGTQVIDWWANDFRL
ncbi:hypothetical protein JCM10212_001619 [Sporobolomyces blumeae]